MKKETLLVLSAHTDDFVLGAGGMIITAIQEGKKVIPIVFSLGEKSHFWMKDKVIKKVRAEETFAATKLLKCREIVLDVKDGQIYTDYQDKNIEQRLLEIIEKEKPTKIFTHSNEDPHPDHRAVNKITLELLEKTKLKPEVYIYSIWNPVSLKTSYPALYVDITTVFTLKMKALKMFQSQKVILSYPLLLLFIRNIIDGMRIRKRFAEKFYKIK